MIKFNFEEFPYGKKSTIRNYILLSILIVTSSNFLFSQSDPPNFVFIMLDDMGWTGTARQMYEGRPNSNSDYFVTPNISAMALDGLTFSQAYAPAPKCAPTRGSLLTGQTPARNSFTNTDNNIATDQILVEATTDFNITGNTMTTYAEWLKTLGLNYTTAHLGKWHQRNATPNGPAANGFDFSDGSTNNDDGNTTGTGDYIRTDPKNMTDLTDRAITFIEDADTNGQPFVLHLSHYTVHSDIECTQDTYDTYDSTSPNYDSSKVPGTYHDDPYYAAMTEDTDTQIGRLLDRISALGLDSNTYIFLFADNGAAITVADSDDNYPLADGKTFISEGGVRVPFIVKGPTVLNQNGSRYITEPVVLYDLFPTIAELTESSIDLPDNMDGQSILPLLEGTTFERERAIYFHSPHYENNTNLGKVPRSAIVDGEYKLVVNYETGDMDLYNVDANLREGPNTILDVSTNPNQTAAYANYLIAYAMQLNLRDYLQEVGASMPSLDATHANFSSLGGTTTDVDNDGLIDAWEFSQLLTYTYEPTDDPDDDGFTNLQEQNNGTDPLRKDIAWTGTTDSDWATASNWSSSAVPSDEDDIVIPQGLSNYPVIDSNSGIIVNDLTIASGASLTLESSSTIYASIIVNGDMSGIATYKRYTNVVGSGTSGGNDLVSAPVTGQDFSSFAVANTNLAASGTLRAFAEFDITANTFKNYDTVTNASTLLTEGLGYRAATTTGSTLTYEGIIHTDNVAVPIAIGTGSQWNLIGNPYPSYIDIDDFLNNNNHRFDENYAGIYGYNADTSDHWSIFNLASSILNPGTLMAPGQGFFVAAAEINAQDITFTTKQRSLGSSDDFIAGRSANFLTEIAYSKLHLVVNNNDYTTDICFINGTSPGLDPGYDTGFYGGAVPHIFTQLAQDETGVELGIQSLPYQSLNSISVPLGVRVDAGNELMISLDPQSLIPPGINIYLEDTANSEFTLLNTHNYSVTSTTTLNGVGRFYLHYSATVLSVSENPLNDLVIYTSPSPKTISINGKLMEKSIAILYDIQGREILNVNLDVSKMNNTIDISTLSQGIYVIKVHNNQYIKTQKLVIR